VPVAFLADVLEIFVRMFLGRRPYLFTNLVPPPESCVH
jgi:hypothetical protein